MVHVLGEEEQLEEEGTVKKGSRGLGLRMPSSRGMSQGRVFLTVCKLLIFSIPVIE